MHEIKIKVKSGSNEIEASYNTKSTIIVSNKPRLSVLYVVEQLIKEIKKLD